MIKFDKGCDFYTGPKLLKGESIPFFDSGSERTDIDCVHCERLTAMTQEQDGKRVGIIALARKTSGLMVAYDAKKLRSFASQINAMADHIDKMNKEGGADGTR